MKINIGHAVEGDNFFGRERELKRMAEIWQSEAAGIFTPVPAESGRQAWSKNLYAEAAIDSNLSILTWKAGILSWNCVRI